MARKYDWGDGNGAIHSIPLTTHQANENARVIPGITINGKPLTQGAYNNGDLLRALVPDEQTRNNALHGTAAGAAPAAGGDAGAAPTSGGPAQIVPDAQFLAEATQRAFERTTQINSFTEEGKNDRSDTQRAIDRLLEQAQNDRATIGTSAGKEGLFYSGQLTKRLGDYEKKLSETTGDQTTGLQQREDARNAAIKALQQGAPLEDAAGLVSAGQRQVTRDTAAADVGGLPTSSVAAPSVPPIAPVTTVKAPGSVINNSGNARAGQAYVPKPAAGGTWHVYNGRRVFVPARR